jgi:ribose-phosphate pyrophosphokinase
MTVYSRGELKVFAGSSNDELASRICHNIRISPGKIKIHKFSDAEFFIEIGENVRGRDVFVVQSLCNPVNDNLMELLIIIDALKRASAGRITAAIPYYGYARQDRKSAPRVPISAKLIADLLHAAGAQRVLTMDLHAGQIQGFFNIPVDNLFASQIFLPFMREHFMGKDFVVVSPDAGGMLRARAYGKILHAPIAMIDKRRPRPNEAEVMNIIGNVEGFISLILDDISDTCGTLSQAAAALKDRGAKEIYAFCTHPVLSGPAVQRIIESCIEKLYGSDTIPLSETASQCPKIEVISVAQIFARAIISIHQDDSISSLFAIQY